MTSVNPNDDDIDDDIEHWVRSQLPPSPSVGFMNRCLATIPGGGVESRNDGLGNETRCGAPVIIDTSSPQQSSVVSSSYFSRYLLQVGPFSYLVSALLMCIALVAAWQYKIVDCCDRLGQSLAPSVAGGAAQTAVACVTGMSDCQWGGDPALEQGAGQPLAATDFVVASTVPAGRQIRLDSGLFEITFRSGAKVLLQGPAIFRVETNGGFLALGRLTGKFELASKHLSRQSPAASDFTIRTPTAIIVDLGTEFGVDVDNHGGTTSHVFRGAIQMRSVAMPGSEAVVLRARETARVETGGNGAAAVHQIKSGGPQFVRSLGSGQIPMEVFSTGQNVAMEQSDPHWEIVAASNNPDFQPRTATVVSSLGENWKPQTNGSSKWISLGRDWCYLEPTRSVFTFRTKFELDDNDATDTAVLKGQFLACKTVRAIRLNGRPVAVPEQNREAATEFRTFVADPAESEFHSFAIRHGFVVGDNTLEFDVEPKPASADGALSAIGLRVVLSGSVEQKP